MDLQINIFNDGEKEAIKKEFIYCADDDKNLQTVAHQSFNFTDRNLNSTQHVLLRNLSSKSIILAPFNTTKSHLSMEICQTVQELMIEKNCVIKFGMRVKEIDKNYEQNNNVDLDNGVFNKFAQAAEKKAHENNFLRQSRQLFSSKSSSVITVDKLEKAIK